MDAVARFWPGDYAEGIHRANRLKMDDQAWSFPEIVHGKAYTAGGTHPMGWSAAAAGIAEQAVNGNQAIGGAS